MTEEVIGSPKDLRFKVFQAYLKAHPVKPEAFKAWMYAAAKHLAEMERGNPVCQNTIRRYIKRCVKNKS